MINRWAIFRIFWDRSTKEYKEDKVVWLHHLDQTTMHHLWLKGQEQATINSKSRWWKAFKKRCVKWSSYMKVVWGNWTNNSKTECATCKELRDKMCSSWRKTSGLVTWYKIWRSNNWAHLAQLQAVGLTKEMPSLVQVPEEWELTLKKEMRLARGNPAITTIILDRVVSIKLSERMMKVQVDWIRTIKCETSKNSATEKMEWLHQ